MQQCIHTGKSLCMTRNGHGTIQRGTIGTPGDGEEEWVEPAAHTIDACEEIFESRFGLWGEEFEGVVAGGFVGVA